MEKLKLVNSQEVKTLKERIEVYKQAIDSVKEGQLIKDFLNVKRDNLSLKKQVTYLEGVLSSMENNTEEKNKNASERYEEVSLKMKQIQAEIKELKNNIQNLKLEQLNENISTLLKREKEQNTVIPTIEVQQESLPEPTKEEKREGMEKNTNIRQSDFKRLQNMLVNGEIMQERNNHSYLPQPSATDGRRNTKTSTRSSGFHFNSLPSATVSNQTNNLLTPNKKKSKQKNKLTGGAGVESVIAKNPVETVTNVPKSIKNVQDQPTSNTTSLEVKKEKAEPISNTPKVQSTSTETKIKKVTPQQQPSPSQQEPEKTTFTSTIKKFLQW